MTVNDAVDFYRLILQCGMRSNAEGNLKEFLECVQFYSAMCGCNPETKGAKFVECNQRYKNFLKHNLSSVTSEILRYEQQVTFNFEGQFVTFISR